jgi:predicted kinase
MKTWGNIIISPDRLLYTEAGNYRWTKSRGARAWEKAYALLEAVLACSPDAELHLVCGIQGAGKTSWIESRQAAAGQTYVYFDATFPTARVRQRAIWYCSQFGRRARCVYLDTPLQICLERNRARPADRRVPDEVVIRTYQSFEPPSVKEGFYTITVLNAVGGALVTALFGRRTHR